MNTELTRVEYDELMALAPLDRAKKAAAMIEAARRRMSRLSTLRAQALLELRKDHTLAEIGDLLGVSTSAVHKLTGSSDKAIARIRRPPAPTGSTISKSV